MTERPSSGGPPLFIRRKASAEQPRPEKPKSWLDRIAAPFQAIAAAVYLMTAGAYISERVLPPDQPAPISAPYDYQDRGQAIVDQTTVSTADLESDVEDDSDTDQSCEKAILSDRPPSEPNRLILLQMNEPILVTKRSEYLLLVYIDAARKRRAEMSAEYLCTITSIAVEPTIEKYPVLTAAALEKLRKMKIILPPH